MVCSRRETRSSVSTAWFVTELNRSLSPNLRAHFSSIAKYRRLYAIIAMCWSRALTLKRFRKLPPVLRSSMPRSCSFHSLHENRHISNAQRRCDNSRPSRSPNKRAVESSRRVPRQMTNSIDTVKDQRPGDIKLQSRLYGHGKRCNGSRNRGRGKIPSSVR
jgi:hypothetical protein